MSNLFYVVVSWVGLVIVTAIVVTALSYLVQ